MKLSLIVTIGIVTTIRRDGCS